MSDKKRVDVALVERGLAQSREKAQALVMSGVVYIGENKVDKASTQVTPEDELIVRQTGTGYVSRGALKLEKGLAVFGVEAKERVAMDLGASTGGFTDVLLQNGAAHVYAIDVGYGQLDWKLRNDPRVVNMEKVNVRYLEPDTIPERMDFVSIDVSFISLKLIFPVVRELLKKGGELVCLIKPQFEAGREQVGKKGIVRDRDVHRQVIENVIIYAVSNGLKPEELTFSPMTGAKGNIEYLLRAVNVPEGSFCDSEISKETIGSVIGEAHLALQK